MSMADFGMVLDPAILASLHNTLTPAGLLSQQEAQRAQQEAELAQRTQQATQASQAATQAYQGAAAAPVPEPSALEQFIPTLLGNTASVLTQDPSFRQHGQEEVRTQRKNLLQTRMDNLTALRDNYSKAAEASERAGDLETSLKHRTRMEMLDKTRQQLNTDRARDDAISEGEKDRQNRLSIEGLRRKDEGAKEARQDKKSHDQNLNTLVDNMRQDPDIKLFGEVRDGFERVKIGAGRKGAIGDLSLLYGYIKILDPGSVVREGEYANAANTAGIPENIRRLYNKAIDGSKLTQGQRDEFVATSRQLYQAKQKNKDKAQSYWRRQAKSVGVDPELLIRDLNTEDAVAPVATADVPSAPAAPRADGKVHVRRKSDGRTGWLLPNDPDIKLFERIP